MPTLRATSRKKRLLPDGKPRYVRVYDLGDSGDRYTVVFTGRYTHKTGGAHWYLGMSGAPFHPQGVCMHGEGKPHAGPIDRTGSSWGAVPIGRKNHLGTRIRWEDLPPDCQKAAIQTYLNLWDLTT